MDGEEGAKKFKEMVTELMSLNSVSNVGDFAPTLAWVDTQNVIARMKHLHYRYDDMMDHIIKEREVVGGDGNDMLTRIREHQQGRI